MLSVFFVAASLLVTGPASATPCLGGGECPSGFCVDGVCCESECVTPCMACSAAAMGGGADGVCELVTAGLDPHDDCEDQGAATCGTDGTCDGAGQCALYAAGAVCVPSSCDGQLFFTPAHVCDGAGTCLDAGPGEPCLHDEPCKLDLCGENGCEIVIKEDLTPCGPSLVCVDGVCGESPTSTTTTGSGGGAPPATGAATTGAGGGGGAPASEDRVDEGGCGCRLEGPTGADPGGALALLVLGASAAWRRRRIRAR